MPSPGHGRRGRMLPAVLAVVALAAGSVEPGAAGPPGAGRAQERVPVLLVPGWLDTERDLAALRIRLVAAGWPSDAVEGITFREPTGSNVDHAREVADAVERLRARTGAARVDIVAHSMGGLAVRGYLKTFGGGAVRRVVFLASPHAGTYSAYVAWGTGGDEMKPGSPFLEELNAGPPLPEGVEALTIRTPIDTHIVPGESATLPGVPDSVVCCPTHSGLLRDERVFHLIADFLSRGD